MKTHIQQLLRDALARIDNVPADFTVDVERARDRTHGDYASNAAMQLAKPLRDNPRNIARLIIEQLPASELVASAEIAGPGFINFRLSEDAYHRELSTILERSDAYGHSNAGGGRKVIVEFVSANPTGPLHVGHGRHAAYGDSVARLLQATGHAVHREYYVNDAGRQMDILALSVFLRLRGEQDLPRGFPGGAYRGDYLRQIADAASPALTAIAAGIDTDALFAGIPAETPDTADAYLDRLIARLREMAGEDNFLAFLRHALDSILGDIRDDLAEFGVVPDEWFSEQSLMDNGAVSRALAKVAESGKSYQRDGATWFRATDYGDEKDRVIVRENGRTTYFASDIAYHLYKRERQFELLLDILGADHHGYVARVRAGLEAMGEPADCLEVQLVQFVALFRGTEKMQMSTRSGEFITLRQLRDEVGNDAARFFFVMRGNDQHLDFDLELAKSSSSDNPVYYIQYAHARVCSIMRELKARGIKWEANDASQALGQLNEEHEHVLMQSLCRFPEMVEQAARQRAPQQIVHYLRDVAQEFHTYYNAHRFIVDDGGVRNARIMLALATRQVLCNGLSLVGVSAPESM